MLTKGLINSEYVMMKLTDRLGKDKAHHTVYELAMETASGERNYSDVLKSSPVLRDSFSEQEIDQMLKPESYIGLCAETAQRVADRARESIRNMENK
nr:hypothetical protein [Vibrio sp. 99-8-1]